MFRFLFQKSNEKTSTGFVNEKFYSNRFRNRSRLQIEYLPVDLVRVENGIIKDEINILVQAPEYEKHCTYRIFRQNLASLCEHYKINLDHHDALSDAKACAELFSMHLKSERIM